MWKWLPDSLSASICPARPARVTLPDIFIDRKPTCRCVVGFLGGFFCYVWSLLACTRWEPKDFKGMLVVSWHEHSFFSPLDFSLMADIEPSGTFPFGSLSFLADTLSNMAVIHPSENSEQLCLWNKMSLAPDQYKYFSSFSAWCMLMKGKKQNKT